ncbi:hypothetical protein THRCLA_05131 [Thraustotheca clavata]|uniref:TLC domain-containing protein n=1 Tax=Thraustotheca clavata TaxID=74557 RepID=A0A1V9ZWW3_9STRA|nr:hypothetical protein THRCLA_05131 [Thraustotheca clavata]
MVLSLSLEDLMHKALVFIYFTLVGLVLFTLDQQYLPLLLLFIVFVAIFIHVVKTFFGMTGTWFSKTYLQHLGNPLRKKTALKKFCDQGWFLALHMSLSLADLFVLKDETWWHDTKTCWDSTSPNGAFKENRFAVHALYVFQLGMYIYVGFSCEYLEVHRKDHLVMMGHHVVTIALIIWSYAVGYLPIGVIIMFLHDVSDIPLDMLKMVNYLKMEDRKGWFVTEILFVITLIEWIYFRVYLFPTKLMNSTIYELRYSCMPPEAAADLTILFPHPGPTHWFWFNLLFISLYMLHIWWTFLLIRILIGVLTVGANSVSKEEYEGASSDSDVDAKKSN